ncbi:MAG TPA: outer membrane beta-barrel protein [Thermoanaerobaculia bacterium]|nr:outer membrane beta-barrel protein [Thermoanaerobaculia bacterium]
MRIRVSLALALLVLVPALAGAQTGSFDLGVRPVLLLGDGTPANDIPGYGVFGHYRLSDRWRLGFAVDRAEYDFETPAKILGLEQSRDESAIDSLAESTTVSAWLERAFPRPSGRSEWFLGAGLGFASIDVPDASGPLQNGGRFDIHTEADSEVVVQLLAGIRRQLGQRWALEFALRGQQHFADWTVTDSVSGRTGSIDDYTTHGGHLGLSFRF